MNKSFIYAFWFGLFAMLYYGASVFLEHRENPNQNPISSNISGVKKVVLYPNSQHSYYVNGYINGIKTKFLIDTGATTISVPHKLASKFLMKKGTSGYAQTANGKTKVYNSKIKQLQISDINLINLRAIINMGSDSDTVLLGMSALKKLNINFENHNLILSQ